MAFCITTTKGEKTFSGKEMINIGTSATCDVTVDLEGELLLTLRCDEENKKCTLLNPFNNANILFKGEPVGTELEISNVCKLKIRGTEEFITIKIVGEKPTKEEKEFTEEDLQCLYGKDFNATIRLKLEKQKADIEAARVAIIKEVAVKIHDLKKKLSSTAKSGVFLHIALIAASTACAFGTANYLTGLPLKEAETIINMPTNLKAVFVYTVIIFGIGLILKQGVFLFFQNGTDKKAPSSSKIAEKFMITMPLLFYAAIYLINVLYFSSPGGFMFFAILISMFFVATSAVCAAGCGYMHALSTETSQNLEKYEYREDFEKVVKAYEQWIEYFVNSMSKAKINNIKDKLYTLKIKSAGETLLGIVTAPFLAYGVSNTLAMCFPEAAGWVRISGLRFSPIFLVLATFMIIFAFFAFVNAFFTVKKVKGSEVLKNDGFSSLESHGVNIFGLEGERKLNSEKKKSLAIGICIVLIEFSMNISYFSQEIGQDLSGLLLSATAALVPTALLIAETYMLSQTKFEIYAREEVLEKRDGE